MTIFLITEINFQSIQAGYICCGVGGGGGGGGLGLEGYRWQKKRDWEAGFLRWRETGDFCPVYFVLPQLAAPGFPRMEPGDIKKKIGPFCNISQYK